MQIYADNSKRSFTSKRNVQIRLHDLKRCIKNIRIVNRLDSLNEKLSKLRPLELIARREREFIKTNNRVRYAASILYPWKNETYVELIGGSGKTPKTRRAT